MRQILPHHLWLGHAGDGRDFRAILDAGIQAVVQLAAEEPAMQLPRELIYYRFPLVDGIGNDARLLQLAIQSLADLLKAEIASLVCCGGGMSRSPAIAAAALASTGQGSLPDCLENVAVYHRTDVSPGLWTEIERVFVGGSFGGALE